MKVKNRRIFPKRSNHELKQWQAMNTQLSNEKKIKAAFLDKFDIEDDYKHLEKMLSYRLLGEIEKITDERKILRKDLAKLINVSPSYITQLYRGSKVVNLEILAKIEKALNFRFEVAAVSRDLVVSDESTKSRNKPQMQLIENKYTPVPKKVRKSA